MENHDLFIRLRDNETITVWQTGPVKTPAKPVLPQELAKIFFDNVHDFELETPVLPKGCIYYGKQVNGNTFVVLEREKQQSNVYYETTELKNVGFPKLILGVEVNEGKIQKTLLAAVKDIVITKNTELYYYPFSNVHHNFHICWGNYMMHQIEELFQLGSLVDVFLSLKMNDSLYRHAAKKPYRQLLTELQGKEFPDDLLDPVHYTFQEFINQLTKEAF